MLTITAEAPQEVTAGDVIEVKMTIPERVNGFQWTFETEGLSYAGITSDQISIGDQHIGLLQDGLVTMSWNGEQMISGQGMDQIQFTMHWVTSATGQLRDMIRMSSVVTAAEAYDRQDDILDVRLSWEGTAQPGEFALYQNEPNPWNGETVIGFTLPEGGDATLTVFDAAGKQVLRQDGKYAAGYNTIRLTNKELPQTGVLYYRLDSGEYSATKKMVLMQ